MMTSPLGTPDADRVSSYVARFRSDRQGYQTTQNAILRLFHHFPRNQEMEDVLLKAVALNGLYNTRIYAIFEVARHIWLKKVDPRLTQGLPGIVDEIARVEIKGRKRNNYSFATKYCHFHMPDSYPMYDSYVDALLWAYQRCDRFSQFRRYELRDYRRFKGILQDFAAFYSLAQFSPRELDSFLWLYSREYSEETNSL